MIVKPILPIWLMIIISIAGIVWIIYKKELKKNSVIDIILKVTIIVLLFIINLRIMISNGESTVINSDLKILFVIDTSVSMRALDYNGKQERFVGVVQDCEYIINELNGSKFSIITFGNTAKKLTPFTNDSDMIISELKAINLEYDYYAQGTSINLVKDILKKELNEKTIIFFITDGEITKQRRKT